MLKNGTVGEVVIRATIIGRFPPSSERTSNPLIHLKVSRHDMLYLSLSDVANHAHSSEGKSDSGSDSSSEDDDDKPRDAKEENVDDVQSGEEVHDDVVEEEEDKRDDNNGERLYRY